MSDKTYIATIVSPLLYRRDMEEPGNFVLEVHFADTELKYSADVRGFVMKKLATHLASASRDIGIEAHKWRIELPPEFQTAFNLPATLELDQL